VKLMVLQVVENMERETRIELATNSLEGCDSTIELLPHSFVSKTYNGATITESTPQHASGAHVHKAEANLG
jgi:hypothetical protein